MPITHLTPASPKAGKHATSKDSPVAAFPRIGHPDDACITVTHLNEYLEDTLGIPLTGEDQVALPANLGTKACDCALEIAATISENMPELEMALATYARFLEELEALTAELEMEIPESTQTPEDILYLLGELRYAVTRCQYRITIE